jgi:predicted nucleic-acid-binding Zn-ribbon protein
MALTSTCVKCGNTSFEVKEVSPNGSNFKLIFVQCASCGGVVGVTEYFNIGAKIEALAKKLGLGDI